MNFRATKPLLHYGILAFIYAVGAVTLVSHTVLHALEGHDHGTVAQFVTCSEEPAHTYMLTFNETSVSPSSLTVSTCDEITVLNKSGEQLIAAIGLHSHHLHYPGFVETALNEGQSYSFRTAESGTFPIHDHDNDKLAATLIVK